MSEEIVKNNLKHLIEKHTRFYPSGFSISIENETERWDHCLKELGIHNGYDYMAEVVCNLYKEKYGKEYLFSNQCVSYEIEYHTDGYMCIMGYKEYVRNVTSYLFSREYLIEHCRVIDISTRDIKNFRQRTMFNYKGGIRECYKNTAENPLNRSKERK